MSYNSNLTQELVEVMNAVHQNRDQSLSLVSSPLAIAAALLLLVQELREANRLKRIEIDNEDTRWRNA